MKKKIFLTALFLIMAGTMTVSAKVKSITGMTVTGTHTLQAGDVLSQARISTDPGEEGDVYLSISSSECEIISAKLTGGSGSRKTLSTGDKITVTLVLSPVDPELYSFRGTYSKSNIKINGGGTFTSASVSGGNLTVKFTLKPVNGSLNPPFNVMWGGNGKSAVSGDGTTGPGASSSQATEVTGPGGARAIAIGSGSSAKTSSSKTSSSKSTEAVTAANIGKASWSAPTSTSGYYDVYLYRGTSLVKKLTEVKGTAADLYPYMTKKGSYSFKVRTIPVTEEQKKYSTHSDWAESDEVYIDEEHVSDGTGADVSSMKNAGWNKVGTYWYYKYPDGTIRKNGWEKVNDKWYLFDAEGRMLTGKQETKNGVYYLAADGDMQTGWIKIDKEWYYFNPDKASDNEGAMLREAWVKDAAGMTYYLTKTGVMATGWVQIGENWYHFGESGNLSRNTTIDTFYVNEEGVWVK